MTALQNHLLLKLADIICCQDQMRICFEVDNENSIIGKFILSGKEPTQAFRRTVQNNVQIWKVEPNKVRINYDDQEWTAMSFLKVLCLKWAWKLQMDCCDWINEPLHKGYCKMMVEGNDIKDVSIIWQHKMDWPMFFHLFPSLVSVTLSPSQFVEMMTASPSELTHLKELIFDFNADSISDAILALSKYQSKCPSLEAIGFTSIEASEIQYVSDLTFPTIKHLEVNLNQDCCTPLNFTFLSATQKVFPGLKSVHITANTCCDGECFSRSLRNLEKTYKAFDDLKYDFFIKVIYRENSKSRLRSEAFTFLSTKGDVTGYSYSFSVKRVFAGKLLIHVVTVDEDDDDNGGYYDSDDSIFETETDDSRTDDSDY